MLRLMAKVWGWTFLAVGILGFIPLVTPNNHLFGVFHVNAVHNLIHLLTGGVALWVGHSSSHASKLYFLWFGLVYGVVALLGFMIGDKEFLGPMAHNTADAWLHLVIATVSIGLGLTSEGAQIPRRQTT